MAKTARNAPCPCGSGRKYKHCCQLEEERLAKQARDDSRVGQSISDWSVEQFGDEAPSVTEVLSRCETFRPRFGSSNM